MWGLAGLIALASVAVTACGDVGNDEACKEADRVANDIRSAAAEDGIDAPCAKSESELRALGVSEFRAAEYLDACRKYTELARDCRG